jgi:hypothetical protein
VGRYRRPVPYAPAQLVLAAVGALEGANPLAVVTLPALLRAAAAAGVDPTSQAVPFGSTEELALLTDFFQLPRPPDPDRPFLAPWSAQDRWQKKKYPGGALQRLRTDASARGRVLVVTKADPAAGRPRDVWKLTPTAGAELMAPGRFSAVNLVDLAIWFGRFQDVPDLAALWSWFTSVFAPDQGDLVGTVYAQDIPDGYLNAEFSSDPIGDDTAEQLGSLPPAPTVTGSVTELVGRLEQRLEAGGYSVPTGLVRRVLTAWLRGDLVVLVGQPGTGKTLFAGLLGRAMEAELGLDAPLLIPIRADYDEAEFIGYQRLDGTAQLNEFATAVLQTDSPLEARVVVLEEFNLASIETYMASVLVASQEQERLVRLPAGMSSHLPIDTFIIATCNSYRDEPETRNRVSSPTKRRATIITMPNVLGDRFDADPETAVADLALGLVTAEAARVALRTTTHRSAQFDAFRIAALSSVTSLDDLSTAVRDALDSISSAILTTQVGRSWFTLGLLKDVILEVVHAERDETAEMVALGQAVADKLVHQVRGTHSDIQDLRLACAELPNSDEISRLLDRTMDGPADELLPLL